MKILILFEDDFDETGGMKNRTASFEGGRTLDFDTMVDLIAETIFRVSGDDRIFTILAVTRF